MTVNDTPLVVVSGSRAIVDIDQVRTALWRCISRCDVVWQAMQRRRVVEWMHGDAEGVDRLSAIAVGQLTPYDARWPVTAVPADWDRHGQRAGMIRNDRMVDIAAGRPAAVVFAVWDGRSRGTAHTIAAAARRRVPVYIEVVAEPDRSRLRPRASPLPTGLFDL